MSDMSWVFLLEVHNKPIFSNKSTFRCDDYLQIYNDEYSKDFKFDKYCGDYRPSSITSITNKVYIHFHSDSYYNFEGFQLEYQSISKLEKLLLSNKTW